MTDSLKQIEKISSNATLALHHHNIEYVNVWFILSKCWVPIANALYEYKLYDDLNFSNSDTKRIFYHFITKELCDYHLRRPSRNRIIYYFCAKDAFDSEFNIRTSKQRLCKFITTIINKLSKLLPLYIYTTDKPWDHLLMIHEKGNGEIKEMIERSKAMIQSSKIKTYTFQDVKKFVKKFGLNYLDQTYFHNIKIKNIMAK